MRKVVKVGNSHTVALPRALLRELHIEKGDHLALFLGHNGTIVMQRFNKEYLRQIQDTLAFSGEAEERPLPVIK